MALDTLDLLVVVAVVLVLGLMFTKGTLWAVEDDGLGAGGSGSRNLIDTLNETGKRAIVLYGSQTGTAEDYAHKFAKELQQKFGVPTLCADLSDYDYDNFGELTSSVPDFKLAVFLNSTYGEGEPTDDAVEFSDYLDNGEVDLEGLTFANFCLGNSTYEFFNGMGRKVGKMLEEKGATRVGEQGLGDDGMGTMDEDYLAWKDALFDVLKDVLALEEKESSYESALEITENDSLTADSPEVAVGEPDKNYVNPHTQEQYEANETGPFGPTHPYLSQIDVAKQLCSVESERDCIHAEFDLGSSGVKYSTGDHLAIWPSNPDAKVAAFLAIFGLTEKSDVVIDVKSLDKTVHAPVPTPTTYGAVVRYYLEITGPVSRQFVKSIVQFAPDELTKERTKVISDDKDLFLKSVTNKSLDISEVLSELSEGAVWNVPFEFIVESVARIQPRYYSISSSSLSEPGTVHVTAMLEAAKNPVTGKLVTGVTTNLLYDIALEKNGSTTKPYDTYKLRGPRGMFAGYKLPVHVRRSTFKLPSNPDTSVIMVGPGTGVAPFRGFVREKVKQVEIGDTGSGKVVLFYGCRKSDVDFLYKDEWPDYAKRLGSRFEFVTAFSRETSKKVYVQDKMLERSSEIVSLLDNGAFFYVCGDASKMARDVQKALVTILAKEKNVSEEDATEIVKQLKVQNRYQEDVW